MNVLSATLRQKNFDAAPNLHPPRLIATIRLHTPVITARLPFGETEGAGEVDEVRRRRREYALPHAARRSSPRMHDARHKYPSGRCGRAKCDGCRRNDSPDPASRSRAIRNRCSTCQRSCRPHPSARDPAQALRPTLTLARVVIQRDLLSRSAASPGATRHPADSDEPPCQRRHAGLAGRGTEENARVARVPPWICARTIGAPPRRMMICTAADGVSAVE